MVSSHEHECGRMYSVWVRNVLHGAETSYTRVKLLKDESETYGAKGHGAVVSKCALSINQSIN